MLGGASIDNFALVDACPALLVAVHLISPSSVNEAWWIVRTLLSFSVKIRIRLLLKISNPSLYQQTFGAGCPKKYTTNSVFSFSSVVVSFSSWVNLGAVIADLCSVTVSGSESSPGSDMPTAFSALTLNW